MVYSKYICVTRHRDGQIGTAFSTELYLPFRLHHNWSVSVYINVYAWCICKINNMTSCCCCGVYFIRVCLCMCVSVRAGLLAYAYNVQSAVHLVKALQWRILTLTVHKQARNASPLSLCKQIYRDPADGGISSLQNTSSTRPKSIINFHLAASYRASSARQPASLQAGDAPPPHRTGPPDFPRAVTVSTYLPRLGRPVSPMRSP